MGYPTAIDRLRVRLADPFAARSLLRPFATAGSTVDIDLLEDAAERDGVPREEVEAASSAIRARHGA